MKIFTFKDFLEFYTKSLEQCIMNSQFMRVVWNESYGFYLVTNKKLPAGVRIQDATDLISCEAELSQDESKSELIALVKRYNWYDEKEDYTNQLFKFYLIPGLGCLANHSYKPNCQIEPDFSFITLTDINEGDQLTINYGYFDRDRYLTTGNSSLEKSFKRYQSELIKKFHVEMSLFSVSFDLFEKRFADSNVEALDKSFERTKQSYERQKSMLESQMRRQQSSVAQTKAKIAEVKENFQQDKSNYEQDRSDLLERNSNND